MSTTRGQLSSFWPYEAVIVDIDDDTKNITIATGPDQTSREIIPPLYYGGSGDSGVFQSPNLGDRVLCVRVHPGRSGSVQAIKLIPKVGQTESLESDSYVRAGTAGASSFNLGQDDLRILSYGGGQLGLVGEPNLSNVFLGNDKKSGLYISEKDSDVKITMVGRNHQTVSSGHRMTSGVATRFSRNNATANAVVEAGNELLAFYNCVDGEEMGLYPGPLAQNVYHTGNSRNPTVSEYRLVINEMAEHSGYSGWDLENSRRSSKQPFFKSGFNTKSLQRAIGLNNALHLAPHQLVEIIGGNVLSYRGEVLDPNYSVVQIGDADGKPTTGTDIAYEKDRRISRRGIGYHFQLSTNSRSANYGEVSNDTDNYVYAIDKEGTLKVNIPKSSSTGNVLYPTAAEFYRESGGVFTSPATSSVSEKIPITLRNAENQPIYPPKPAAVSIAGSGSGDTSYTRQTGVRYSNDSGYFQNVSATDASGNIRVNTTKHHNMYAAAEMLIANLIQASKIPMSTAACPGIVIGNALGQSFERRPGGIEAAGGDPNDITFMSTVEVNPGPPAISPGGGVIVAGQDFTILTDLNDDNINIPYTNSFTLSMNDAGFVGIVQESESGVPGNSPGGRSANINLEGSLELSIGSDDYDNKSIVLDTAGGLVAWFGKDRNGRSVIIQTDGDVMLNVGGRTGDDFTPGRFELRVNVVDKGYLEDDDNFVPEMGGHASDYIISISEAGLIIAGMKPATPMIIRNDGNISIESTSKIILAANAIEMREANRSPKPLDKAHTQADPGASVETDPVKAAENVQFNIQCLQDLIADMLDDE